MSSQSDMSNSQEMPSSGRLLGMMGRMRMWWLRYMKQLIRWVKRSSLGSVGILSTEVEEVATSLDVEEEGGSVDKHQSNARLRARTGDERPSTHHLEWPRTGSGRSISCSCSKGKHSRR
ncbi:unnamed protein product [Prunus armeniaca]